MLSKEGFFVSFTREMPPCGRQAGCSGCRLLPAQATSPADVNVSFLFYLKCPLACNLGAGCHAEGGGKEREREGKKEKKEIAYQSLP